MFYWKSHKVKKINYQLWKLGLMSAFFQSCNFFNRPDLGGSVIHTPSWFIHWLCQSVILWFKYLENTFTPKPYKLQTWSFEIIITSLRLSHFMCYLSHIKCHMSHVTRPISTFFFFSFFYKVVKIVGWGSVINWAYPV